MTDIPRILRSRPGKRWMAVLARATAAGDRGVPDGGAAIAGGWCALARAGGRGW
jgi:hypothetical protein